MARKMTSGEMLLAREAGKTNPFTGEQDDAIERGVGVGPGQFLKVVAFAGAGKTTGLTGVAQARTQLAGIDRVGLYLAFNKVIADAAGPKFKPYGCLSKTMHALALHAIGLQGGGIKRIDVNTIKAMNVVPQVRGSGLNEFKMALSITRTIDAFCASADSKLTEKNAREALVTLIPNPDIIKDRLLAARNEAKLATLVGPVTSAARRVMQAVVDGSLPHSHNTYLKFLDLSPRLRARAFDGIGYIMIDEAQDLNPVQRSILEKSGLPIIAVGDPYQQIYSWRGAENALALMPDNYATVYFTQSFRFGEAIAAAGRWILASRPDNGPEKRLTGARKEDAPWPQGPETAIICRTNTGVIHEALTHADSGKAIHLTAPIDDLIVDVESAIALREGRLDQMRSEELMPYTHWSQLEEAAEHDRALAKVIELVEEDRLDDLRKLEQKQTKRITNADLVITTAHRFKGAEAPNVVLSDDFRNQKRRLAMYEEAEAKGPKAVTRALEEWNTLYVAGTRAISNLSAPADLIEPSLQSPSPTGLVYTPDDQKSPEAVKSSPSGDPAKQKQPVMASAPANRDIQF